MQKWIFFSRKKRLDGAIVVYTFFVRMRRIYLSLSPSLCSTAAGSKSFLNEYKYVMVCYIRVLRKYIFQVVLLNKGLVNLPLHAFLCFYDRPEINIPSCIIWIFDTLDVIKNIKQFPKYTNTICCRNRVQIFQHCLRLPHTRAAYLNL